MLEVKISTKNARGNFNTIYRCPNCFVSDVPRNILPIMCYRCGAIHRFDIEKLVRLRPERIRFYRGIESQGSFMG